MISRRGVRRAGLAGCGRSAPALQPRNSRSAPAGAAGGPASSGGQGSGGGPLRFMLRDLAGLFTKP